MGGSAPEQKETSAEKIAATNASQRWSERTNDGYLDLEKRQIADSTRDMTSVIHGRSNADVARGERQAYAAAGAPTAANLDEVGNTVGKALASSAVDSTRAGFKYSDTKRMNTVRIGNNMASGTTATLGDMATMANRSASEKLQNRVMVSNAKMQAGMQAVGGAVKGAIMKKQGYGFSLKEGLTRDKSKIPGFDPATDPEPFQDKQKFGYGFIAKQLGM